MANRPKAWSNGSFGSHVVSDVTLMLDDSDWVVWNNKACAQSKPIRKQRWLVNARKSVKRTRLKHNLDAYAAPSFPQETGVLPQFCGSVARGAPGKREAISRHGRWPWGSTYSTALPCFCPLHLACGRRCVSSGTEISLSRKL